MKNNLKMHLWISHAIMAAGCLLALYGVIQRHGQGGISYWVWVAVALVLGSVVYKALTLKCPHCGGFLPTKYKLPQTCPACGRSILEEETSHEEAHP